MPYKNNRQWSLLEDKVSPVLFGETSPMSHLIGVKIYCTFGYKISNNLYLQLEGWNDLTSLEAL